MKGRAKKPGVFKEPQIKKYIIKKNIPKPPVKYPSHIFTN